MLPRSYSVGPIPISPNVVLAPMEGVTDLTFRRLIRQIGGVGLTVTEFIASEGLRRGSAKIEEMAKFDPDEHPVAIQIYGRDPYSMSEAARIIEDSGADICDINMGCPSKKVCAHSGGSALMKDEALARQIVSAVRAAIRIPLTVKMRSGFDAEHRNAEHIAWMCQEEGAQAVTIHWRTRTDLYGGTRAVDQIAAAKSKLSIPVIGNGDIVDAESARRMFADTGCDGVMIGRGAIKNPWVCLQISQDLRGEPQTVVDAAEKKRVLLAYIDSVRSTFRTEQGALGRVKKVANHFTHGVPHGSDLRYAMLHSDTLDQAVEEVHVFFERLAARERGERPWLTSPAAEAPSSP